MIIHDIKFLLNHVVVTHLVAIRAYIGNFNLKCEGNVSKISTASHGV